MGIEVENGVLKKYTEGEDAVIIVPNGVTEIGYGAFAHCVDIKEVRLPDGITSIENGAFFECYSLISVNIPNSVTSIGT